MGGILVEITLVVISAVATYYVPILIERVSNRSFARHMSGEWVGSYRYYGKEDLGWINEPVTVNASGSTFKIVSDRNPDRLDYEADMELVKGNFVIGTWEALTPHSRETGTMSLILPRNGRYMYGIWAGFTDDGKYFYSPCVYAKKTEDLTTAISLVEDMVENSVV
jgi:hypothetical protein